MLAFSCWLRWVCVVFFFFKCLSCERITNLTVKWETNVISINCRKNIVVVDVGLHTATTTHSSWSVRKPFLWMNFFFVNFKQRINSADQQQREFSVSLKKIWDDGRCPLTMVRWSVVATAHVKWPTQHYEFWLWKGKNLYGVKTNFLSLNELFYFNIWNMYT